MISPALIALALISGALATPTPTAPGPSDAFTALGECNIAWNADTNATKPWTTMNIQFMTGSNAQMTHMRTVATVDATKQTTFSWICPEVDPNAPIYFYQFSSPVDPTNLLWVTRFVIKGTDGSSVPAPSTDPTGVKYGLGTFTDPSLYNAMPSYLVGNGQLQGGPTNGTTPTTTPGSSVPLSTTTTGVVSSASGPGTGVSTSAGPNTGTITKVTTTNTRSSPSVTSTTTTSSSGARPGVSSSSWMALVALIVGGAVVLPN